jgi:hypothetical protein
MRTCYSQCDLEIGQASFRDRANQAKKLTGVSFEGGAGLGCSYSHRFTGFR